VLLLLLVVVCVREREVVWSGLVWVGVQLLVATLFLGFVFELDG
jgi:hypothetical protein